MEEILRKLTLQPPPQGLRERVLTAARAELKQAGEKQDWLDRLWESHAYWYSSAAAVLVCLIALFLAPDGAPSAPGGHFLGESNRRSFGKGACPHPWRRPGTGKTTDCSAFRYSGVGGRSRSLRRMNC